MISIPSRSIHRISSDNGNYPVLPEKVALFTPGETETEDWQDESVPEIPCNRNSGDQGYADDGGNSKCNVVG